MTLVTEYRALKKKQRELMRRQEKFIKKYTWFGRNGHMHFVPTITMTQKAALKRRAKLVAKKYMALDDKMDKLLVKMTPAQKRAATKLTVVKRKRLNACLIACKAMCKRM